MAASRYDRRREDVNLEHTTAKGGMSTSKKAAIGIVVFLLVGGVVGVIVYFAAFHNKTDQASTSVAPATTAAPIVGPPQGLRVDCLPEIFDKSEVECKKRAPLCVWDGGSTANSDKCYVDKKTDTGLMLSASESPDQKTQIHKLTWSGVKQSIFSKPEDIIKNVNVKITKLSNNVLQIKIIDADSERYEVPFKLNPEVRLLDNPDYDIETSTSTASTYYIKIKRKDGTVIFDTSRDNIVFEKQYLRLSTVVPTKNVYGFGENLHSTFKHQFAKTEVWPALARDQPPGADPGMRYDNLYGVHPFYVCIEDSGNAHGVLSYNSNIQDFTLTPEGMITYQTIGGVFDFYIFTGPTPENVIQQYTKLIGTPYLPPYWALGFQLCRYGYRNTTHIEEVVNRTRKALIPHDVQYADIDYMDARKDFTIDSKNFGDLGDYFTQIRETYSMKTIIILDPALSIVDGYDVYPQGKAANIYITWPNATELKAMNYTVCANCSDDKDNMLGYVWPDDKTVFPDYFKSSTKELWKQWIVNQSLTLPFDGIWIDMNEPANFDTNKDFPWNWKIQRPNDPEWNLKCDMSHPLERPPYKTKACYLYKNDLRNISDKTVCMVGKQGEKNEYYHYDVHNLYGHSQCEPTLRALRNATSKRGMVISRSTFPGSGQFAGHWLGDNTANWQHLKDSVIGMLEFNLFGIPYVGADICGFFGNSSAELCKRWMQVGAFYPFSRNHNGKGDPYINIDQDPAAYQDPTVVQLSRSSLETRYKLLPYLYTLFYRANAHGGTVVRPVQFEWPRDNHTLDISEQFLWGASIMFSPILRENQTSLEFYLPPGNNNSEKWYDYYTKKNITSGSQKISVNGTSEIPIHIRGGSIIPMKESALTTTDSRKTPFKLLIALDAQGKAQGDLYWDDGDSIDPTGKTCYIKYFVENKRLFNELNQSNCLADLGSESLKLNQLIFWGVNDRPSQINVTSPTSGSSPTPSFIYDNDSLSMVVNIADYGIQTIKEKIDLVWG